MVKRGFKARFAKWCDEWKLAFYGIALASRKPKFIAVFALTFLLFGTLMSLLSSGAGAMDLFFATDLPGKLRILGNGMLNLFGIGRNFLDWLLVFCIAILQGILIALIALVWKKKHDANKDGTGRGEHLQNAGIVAGLAVLGSGCPTCGTALITPILGVIFASSGYALAGMVSGIITFTAIVIALLSLKKVGEDAYAIMIDEKWRKNGKSRKDN